MRKLIGTLLMIGLFSTAVMAQKTADLGVSTFTDVRIGGAFDVRIQKSDKNMVQITASAEDLARISTEVNNGMLEIRIKGNNDGWNWGDWNSSRNVKIVIYYTESLKSLASSGSSDIETNEAIKSDRFALKLSGSGDFKGAVEVNDLEVTISGSADIDLAGTAKNHTISISGSGDIDAFDLKSSVIKVKVSGSGNANVYATEELEARVSGSGSIRYKGNPTKLISKSSGSGDITKEN